MPCWVKEVQSAPRAYFCYRTVKSRVTTIKGRRVLVELLKVRINIRKSHWGWHLPTKKWLLIFAVLVFLLGCPSVLLYFGWNCSFLCHFLSWHRVLPDKGADPQMKVVTMTVSDQLYDCTGVFFFNVDVDTWMSKNKIPQCHFSNVRKYRWHHFSYYGPVV